MLDLTSKIVRNTDSFLLSALGNEIVMMDTRNGKYIGLNQVSSDIWNYLEKGLSATELIDRLVSEYEVERGECESQTLECLNKMEQQGLISAV
ncbi:hypothetical protein PBAL39_09156 [Pedobacter sp. BAL39]|uniref:PqqD family peptide modification chaperone n=1 Tax=Pedobacter sp. BAL39 TaxID=391596 RepID=UPI00015599C5|nr:PqqD family peptide modification chaperone [Pedobacter sp. BAL39]EDM37299.1 hypothetical protein PBAL39_09156 [Pedobacter sp. BAL39]